MALSNIAGVEWGEFSGLVAVFTEDRSNKRYLISYSKDELSPNVVKFVLTRLNTIATENFSNDF